ncbi:MAG: hypothetical protein IPM82_05350 [Saprospiraceae bacterium]|nr:hypothetical protein [Saprospiraceae bacterium]
MLLSGSFELKAQDVCESGYLAFRQGVSFELTNYDKKGKSPAFSIKKSTAWKPLLMGSRQG